MSRSEKVEIRLSPPTKARWVEAAGEETVSGWIRRLAEEELSRRGESGVGEVVSEPPLEPPEETSQPVVAVETHGSPDSAADLPPQLSGEEPAAFGVALEEPAWRGPDPK